MERLEKQAKEEERRQNEAPGAAPAQHGDRDAPEPRANYRRIPHGCTFSPMQRSAAPIGTGGLPLRMRNLSNPVSRAA